MKKTIVFATKNENKARELRAILDGYEILMLSDIGFEGEIEEDGSSFTENALIKARAAHAACGKVCVADDSGLCVDALGGAPGIYSSRYSGEGDKANNEKLLKELAKVPENKRTAHFTSAAAAVFGSGKEAAEEAEVYGKIDFAPSGDGGFGYDPLFIEDKTGKKYSEMTDEEKNGLSHRKLAFEKLKPFLDAYFDAHGGER